MAKKRSANSDVADDLEAPEETPVIPETPPAPPKVEVKDAIQRISFSRWFSTTGRPSHHKAGFKAYANTNGRKTKVAWDVLFAKY